MSIKSFTLFFRKYFFDLVKLCLHFISTQTVLCCDFNMAYKLLQIYLPKLL